MDEKYLALLQQFPLLPIASGAEHQAAKAMINNLILRDGTLSATEIGYGQVLIQLVQTYEKNHMANFFNDVPGNEALEYLLSEHDMPQTEVAKIAGVSRQNINDFLKGRRGLPKEAQLKLAKHFKLQHSVFETVRELNSA